jgi:hypothetical protein
MAAGKLKQAQKRQVVQWLACFEGPKDVVDRIKLEFGIEISAAGVLCYDPTTAQGDKLREDLKVLFEETREKFINDVSDIDIAHQSFRLKQISVMHRAAVKQKNYGLAAQLLEQAAKERGGMFTNKRELSGPNGGAIPVEVSKEDKSREVATAMLKKLVGNGMSESEARESLIKMGVDDQYIPIQDS